MCETLDLTTLRFAPSTATLVCCHPSVLFACACCPGVLLLRVCSPDTLDDGSLQKEGALVYRKRNSGQQQVQDGALLPQGEALGRLSAAEKPESMTRLQQHRFKQALGCALHTY